MRLSTLPWDTVGPEDVVSEDKPGVHPDLLAVHGLANASLEEAFAAPSAWAKQPEWQQWQDQTGADPGELVRDAWTLALLDNHLTAKCSVNFLEEYVVSAVELREQAARYTEARRHGRPRLPVLLRARGQWVVHLPGECWPCHTLAAAVWQWARVVRTRFDGRTEYGHSLVGVLRLLEPRQ